MKYAAHPFADLFPMMSDDEIQELADDIAAKGQKEPIYLIGNLILDGRNRHKACEIAGVKPWYQQYTGDDPLGHVVSGNLRRRHMSESQRAMVAAKLANLNREDTLKQGPRSADLRNGEIKPVTQQEAANLFKVGRRTLQEARKIHKDGAEGLADMVNADEISVHTASTVADLPADEQAEIIKQGPDAVKAKAAEVRKEKQQEKDKRQASTPPDATPQQQATARSPEPKQSPTPSPQQRAASPTTPPTPQPTAGVGLRLSSEAIDVLMRIPRNDPQRARAFEKVRDWLDNN